MCVSKPFVCVSVFAFISQTEIENGCSLHEQNVTSTEHFVKKSQQKIVITSKFETILTFLCVFFLEIEGKRQNRPVLFIQYKKNVNSSEVEKKKESIIYRIYRIQLDHQFCGESVFIPLSLSRKHFIRNIIIFFCFFRLFSYFLLKCLCFFFVAKASVLPATYTHTKERKKVQISFGD